MKQSRFLFFILFAFTANAASLSDVKGDWSGVLDTGVMKLTLVLHVEANKDGLFTAKLDSVEQGTKGITIDSVTLLGDVFKFESKAIGASYNGQINKDLSEIVGQFTQGQSFPLTFRRGIIPAKPLNRPQTPKAPFPYSIIDVTFKNATAGNSLAGTLTVPKTKTPPPVVLLITGSGPQDRDETIVGHKPFWVLADYLSRHGVAVLRVDDRGVGRSTGDFASATSQDFATDALAGVEYLKSRKDINPSKIGLLGHSEGGLVAAIAASKSSDVAFVVMLAGPGVNGEKIMLAQGELILRANGASDEMISLNRKCQTWMFKVVKEESDLAIAKKRLNESAQQCFSEMPPEQQNRLRGMIANQITFVNTPWFREFLTFEPSSVLTKIKVPVLALNGEFDLQVPPKQNLLQIMIALKQGGNKDVTTTTLPGLNHLFQNTKTGSLSEYAQNEETMSENVLKIIADWILSKTS